ncbi:MAG: fused MFS/spermidine synthase [Desulfobulbaceae bacterium]|nr:fused MFS/spermidine synthase [Desulfobulbaceae bacterium]
MDCCKVIHRGSRNSGVTVADYGCRRHLYLDGDTLQSSMLLADPNQLDLEYSQAMMCALLFQPEPRNVLLIGLGGGSLVKFLLEFCPEARIDVAEINPEIVAVARQYFLLPEDERLQITPAPGEVVVADRLAAGGRYDLLLLDAFDDSGPARALLDEQFLCRCRALLTPGGIFAMNLWNRPGDNFAAIHTTLAALFGNGTRKLLMTEANTNAVVFGLTQPVPVRNLMKLKPAARELGRRTGINFVRLLRQLYWQNS